MPWKSKTPVDLRIEFMKRVVKGETVAELCREYGISRKTGDKFKQRFRRLGEAGLLDRSRAPKIIPHKTPPEVVKLLLCEKEKHPSWGPKKLKTQLEERLHREFPAVSTIGDILERAGLVAKRGRRLAVPPRPTTLRTASAPNDVWCIDYKGQFRLGNRSLCYPLTLTDQYSRFILGCDAMAKISDEEARESCEELFRRYGLPKAIRSDNGVPFASAGLANLTKLSAYWLQLGIELERIRPAHPEENGQHERMHRTLKFETTRPPRTNLLQQQERFDQFIEEFNTERPHEALGMKRPAQVYKTSPRRMPAVVPELDYPQHDDVLRVDRAGYVSHRRRRCYLSTALAYQTIGIREEPDGRWLVSFAKLDVGHLDITGFSPL